jgi:threonine dehydrogenase-like Zn-dependent dehydrogenase
VVVRIRATGICGTDIGIIRGDYFARQGVVIGHESAGEIVQLGRNVHSVSVGHRVVIDPTFHCGFCKMCRSDRPNHCKEKAMRESGVSCDGAFASYYITNERFVYKIADHVSFAEASLTEPLSCVLTGLNQLRLRADMDTVVVGAGPIGMLYCYALAARGIIGTIVEKSPARRSACHLLMPPGWSISSPDELKTFALDLAIDTSGHALGQLLAVMRRGGQVLVVGLTGATCELSPSTLADKSLSVIGSIDSIGTFGLANRMIETGVIPVGKLITHQLPLDRYEEAFLLLGVDFRKRSRLTDDVRAVKVVLTP